MIVKILLILVLALGVFLGIAAFQPNHYQVNRSITIAAPPSAVFPHVNDMHKWLEFSPWAKMDPNCNYTFSGPQAGVGASNAWEGNNAVGAGSMTVAESKPDELVRLKLEFLKPMPGNATADFTFKPVGDQTEVTWSMTGEKNFISKAFCLVMSMDKMVGGSFEDGLSTLKSIVETEVGKK